MKRGLLGVLLVGVWGCCCGQTFDEWFFQKKTQINYLYAQIVALQSYDEVVEEGYGVSAEETEAIGGITQADLDQHAGHFSSLVVVNPAVRGMPEVGGTVRMAEEIVELSGSLGAAGPGLLADCSADVGLLEMLVTDGGLGMNDAERMRAILLLYERMRLRLRDALAIQDQLAFVALNSSL